MVYLNWHNSRAHMASYADWFEVTELMKNLQLVKEKHLAGAGVRGAHAIIFPDNGNLAPYKEDMRFPHLAGYICDLVGEWKTKLTQLRAVCLEVVDNADTAPLNHRLYSLIYELIADLLRGASVFNRKEFERWGFVEWQP